MIQPYIHHKTACYCMHEQKARGYILKEYVFVYFLQFLAYVYVVCVYLLLYVLSIGNLFFGKEIAVTYLAIE